ncbi:MAG: hypothetical protein ACM3X9_07505 [Bacillota bacterium]
MSSLELLVWNSELLARSSKLLALESGTARLELRNRSLLVLNCLHGFGN